MAQSVADLALLDQVIVGGPAIQPADLKRIRLGIVPEFMANQDEDARAATQAAFDKLRKAGVTLVEVEMPQIKQLDSDTEFPIVTYEVRDELGAYLVSYHTGVDLQTLVTLMAGPEEKRMYEEQVLPRKVLTRGGDTDLTPVYEHAMRESRPMMRKLYREAFARYRLDGLVFPTEPRGRP